MLDDLKHGNTYYTGVETDKGVLLFSEDIRGEMQYSDYMYKYIENDFFDPEFTVKSLAVHKLRGWPSLMGNKVNRYGEPENTEAMRQQAFQDKSVLKNAIESEIYHLAPTWENYYKLTDVKKGLGLTRGADNYDRMVLLYIKERGYPMDGVIDEYPDSFSFHKQFEKIAGKLTGRDRWDVYDEMQEKAKRLAERLLKENFPAMRQKGTATPERKVEKETPTPKKSKGRKI